MTGETRVAARFLVLASVAFAACVGEGSSSEQEVTKPSSTTSILATSSTASSTAALSYVAFGDSWPEGAHCNGCTPFPGLWAADLGAQTGQEVTFTDLTGEAEPSPGVMASSRRACSTPYERATWREMSLLARTSS